MLEREEALRWAPETLQRMAEAREWLYVAEELQLQVVREFGYHPEDERWAVSELRCAHVRHPELGEISVWARNNLARDGSLREGAEIPHVPLFGKEGPTTLLDAIDPMKPTVLVCGSWS